MPQLERKLTKKFLERVREVEDPWVLPEAVAAELGDFITQLRSFKTGTGPGPTGLRAQFIKEMVGDDGDDPCVEAIFRVVMLFVEARVPKYLRRWYAGGSLVGIGKDDLPLDQDARPIVVGETFRRIAGKIALTRDKGQLSGWLKPEQVAVGVKAGAEVIVHSLRQWWERNQDNDKYVLLKMDYANAFNEAEPQAFLGTARRRLAGAAKMAY